MSKPCIICVAITGSLPRKSMNPAVPITVSEQIESTQAAFEAGASICHAHVRNEDETPSSDPEKFAALKEGLQKHCPGMIIQFSTGGRSGAGRERGGMLPLRPDMASLTVGSNNFPTRVYENPPDLVDWLAAEMLAHGIKPEIEAFDLSHIHRAAAMQADIYFKRNPQIQLQLMGQRAQFAHPFGRISQPLYLPSGALGHCRFERFKKPVYRRAWHWLAHKLVGLRHGGQQLSGHGAIKAHQAVSFGALGNMLQERHARQRFGAAGASGFGLQQSKGIFRYSPLFAKCR